MKILTLAVLTVILLLPNGEITAATLQTVTADTAHPAASQVQLPRFDGTRAMADLVRQVDAGPRLPNSPGLLATRELIKSNLAAAGWEVHTQEFEARSPLLEQTFSGENIFAIYPKETTTTCIISAHYDTRPYADMDPDVNRRTDPVPGANDGASGVAILLELGRLIPQTKPDRGICLAFWDLEDHGAAGSENGFCLGSRYFASNLPPQVKDFQWGINLDMVGGTGLEIPMEGFSLQKAQKLTWELWQLGNSFYPETWKKTRGPMIYDDHMPFLAINRPYADVIDIRYPAWHTTGDTPDKCSAKSLEIVGDTILRFVFNVNKSGKNF